jgi:hypothetical protein
MKPNRPLFIITSALRPTMGVFSFKERYDQTIKTIKSIRSKCPNAYILFADASIGDVPAVEFMVISKMVNFFMKMDEEYNQDVIELSKAKMKSHAETALLYHILIMMKRDPNLQKALYSTNRIFKISGRLELDEGFDIRQYDEWFGKYVFRKRIPTWMNPTKVSDLLVTRLYSFCPSLIDNYIVTLQRNFQMLNDVDTEHAHFANIDPKYLVEFEKVHCKGQVASTGEWHYD